MASCDANDGGARLLREGQALARSSHPNVVAVFRRRRIRREVYVARTHPLLTIKG